MIAPGAQLTDLGCGWLAGLDLRGADLSHANLDGARERPAKAAAGSGVAEQSERGPLRPQVDLTDTLLDCATLDDTTLHWVGVFVARGRRDTSTTRPRHARVW